MKKIFNIFRGILAFSFVTLVVAEIFSMASVNFGLINAPRPSYEMPGFRPFRGDINKYFGLWRHPNAKLSHVASCFNVTYESNSYGARDIERSKKSNVSRTIVLGDSFIGGIGLNRTERFTEKLEAQTSIPHLNFGIVNTGPTQYYLNYRYLAKAFDHDKLIVGILPNNDFRDDDIEYGRRMSDRYRPYFVKDENGNWALTYFDKKNLGTGGNSKKEQHKQQRRAMRQFLTNFLYVKNVWNYMKGIMEQKTLSIHDIYGELRSVEDAKPPSGFYDYTAKDLERMLYVLDLLDTESGQRKIHLVLIPMQLDLVRYNEDGKSPLSQALEDFASTRDDIEIVNLLPEFASVDDPSVNYLSCDGHWNPNGASLAAKIMARDIYGK